MVQRLHQPAERGIDPIDEGPFVHALTEYLNIRQDDNKPTALGTRFRASEALACARQIGFRVIHMPVSNPAPPETKMAFEVGNRVHDVMQDVLKWAWNAEIEVSSLVDEDVSGSLDGIYLLEAGEEKVIVEIKSVAGFGFILATGARRSPEGAGPKPEHLVQAGMYARAHGAKLVHLIYFDKDKNGIAEWVLRTDMPLPQRYENFSIDELVESELARFRGIGGRLDSGQLPARHIPGWGRVDVPSSPGTREEPWNCRYCRNQPDCVKLPSGPVPIEEFPNYGLSIPPHEEGNLSTPRVDADG